jgi:sodium transport system permease protein
MTQAIPPLPTRLTPFSWRQQIAFISKELRETLRDRRTIVTLLAMPLLLYPLLGIGFRFLALQQVPKTDSVYRVAFESTEDAQLISGLVDMAENLKADQQLASSMSDADESDKDKSPSPKIESSVATDPTKIDLDTLVKEGISDVGVRVKTLPAGRQRPWTACQIEIVENANSALSRAAASYLERCFTAASMEQVRLWGTSFRPDFELPVRQSRTKLNLNSGTSAVLGLLPLILLLMTVTGGVYPAIDLTAGERERNTLETLMSLPVPNFRLLFAKFVAVVTVTMLTGLVNLLAMSVTLYALQLDKALLGGQGFTLLLGLKLVLALTAFALFYSAVLLLLTSSARSFKEAQAYLIPLLLLSIGPGLVILMPGWSLGQGTAVIPLVNILLLTKEVLEGTATLLPSLVAILSTILYGVAALAIAAQIFGNDAVALGSRGRWRDLFRRPDEPQIHPTSALAFVGLALLFPAYFVASGVLSRDEGMTPAYRLTISAVLTVVLFTGLPILLLLWQKVPFSKGLSLVKTRWSFFLGAILLGFSTWPWIFEIIVWSQSIGIRGFDASKFEQVQKILEDWKKIPLPLIILAMGVAPGICEECFFRGFLFNGIRRNASGRTTVLATAVIFGLFHVILAGGAAPERLLPSTLMGLVLGWLRLRSDSLMPGIILHVVHNSTLLAIAQYRQELEVWGLGGLHESHLPPVWLIATAITLFLGVVVVFLSRSQAEPEAK